MKNIVILGPKGCGKTTALFWLYQQLLSKGEIGYTVHIEIKYNSLPGVHDKCIFLFDMHNFRFLKDDDVRELLHYITWSDSFFVLSTSSKFGAAMYQNSAVSKLRNVILKCSKQCIFQELDKETALLVFDQQHLFADIDEKTKEEVIEYCHYLPGYFSLYNGNLETFKVEVAEQAFKTFMDVIKEMDDFQRTDLLHILLSILHAVPLKEFYPHYAEDSTHQMVSDYLIKFDKTGTASFCIPVSRSKHEKLLRYILKQNPAISVSSSSAIGQIFECMFIKVMSELLCSGMTIMTSMSPDEPFILDIIQVKMTPHPQCKANFIRTHKIC